MFEPHQVGNRRRDARARVHIAMEGSQEDSCYILLDGVLAQEKMLERGRRQIVGMHLPGDVCGLFGLPDNRMGHNLVALSPVSYLSIRTQWLASLTLESREMLEAVWREMSREAAIAAAWVANIGQRPAYQRLAHLFCELHARRVMQGRDLSPGFRWLGTQEDLRAATGLSLVHVNKTLRRMEAEELVSCGRHVEVHDVTKLAAIAGFDPTYLARDRASLADLLISRIDQSNAVDGILRPLRAFPLAPASDRHRQEMREREPLMNPGA